MYFFDDERHKSPHIHAKFQREEAVFSIKDEALLTATLAIKNARLVQAWVEIHRESLMAGWALAIKGEALFLIEPLC